MKYQFKILQNQINTLYSHLFPGDNLEAVSIIICGHHVTPELTILTAHDIFNVPHEECQRESDFLHWKTESIIHVLENASKNNLSVFKIHSHPGGYESFSKMDNEADLALLPSVYGWIDGDNPHGSLVMLPDKTIFGRIVSYEKEFIEISKISIIGDEIKIFSTSSPTVNKDISLRNIQAFGLGTVRFLKSLKVGVVGASGTGSPVIEQLVRLGLGEIVIIDPDLVEEKNLNRILNTSLEDSKGKTLKVDVFKRSIKAIGFDTKVKTFSNNLYESREAIEELTKCDFLFGCVDSVDGRHLLNQISTFYLIPYFDIGIKLEADGKGGIQQINGAVHYIKPGGSSLMSRGVYSIESLESANLFRQNPDEFKERLKEKYIKNIEVVSPAVISVNMFVASYAVNEFLDRVHSYKSDNAKERAKSYISITENLIFTEVDGNPDTYLLAKVGKGDCTPLLEMSEL